MECPYCDIEMESLGDEEVCPVCRLAITIPKIFNTAQTKLPFFFYSQPSHPTVSYVVQS